MSESGQYGKSRLCAGIVGHADLRLGDGVARVLEAEIAAGDGRFRGIRHSVVWDASEMFSRGRTNSPKGQMADTTIILNHVGGPLGIGPYADKKQETFAVWEGRHRRTRQMPKCHRHALSSAGTRAPDPPAPAAEGGTAKPRRSRFSGASRANPARHARAKGFAAAITAGSSAATVRSWKRRASRPTAP